MRVFQTLHWDIPFLHLQFEGIHLVYVTWDSVRREGTGGREGGGGGKRSGGRKEGRGGGGERKEGGRRGREGGREEGEGGGERKEGWEGEGREEEEDSFKECAGYIKLKSQCQNTPNPDTRGTQ